jgi:hypothetical protein
VRPRRRGCRHEVTSRCPGVQPATGRRRFGVAPVSSPDGPSDRPGDLDVRLDSSRDSRGVLVRRFSTRGATAGARLGGARSGAGKARLAISRWHCHYDAPVICRRTERLLQGHLPSRSQVATDSSGHKWFKGSA